MATEDVALPIGWRRRPDYRGRPGTGNVKIYWNNQRGSGNAILKSSSSMPMSGAASSFPPKRRR
jgi:hypothetical protein